VSNFLAGGISPAYQLAPAVGYVCTPAFHMNSFGGRKLKTKHHLSVIVVPTTFCRSANQPGGGAVFHFRSDIANPVRPL